MIGKNKNADDLRGPLGDDLHTELSDAYHLIHHGRVDIGKQKLASIVDKLATNGEKVERKHLAKTAPS